MKGVRMLYWELSGRGACCRPYVVGAGCKWWLTLYSKLGVSNVPLRSPGSLLCRKAEKKSDCNLPIRTDCCIFASFA